VNVRLRVIEASKGKQRPKQAKRGRTRRRVGCPVLGHLFLRFCWLVLAAADVVRVAAVLLLLLLWLLRLLWLLSLFLLPPGRAVSGGGVRCRPPCLSRGCRSSFIEKTQIEERTLLLARSLLACLLPTLKLNRTERGPRKNKQKQKTQHTKQPTKEKRGEGKPPRP
jgi:hypothetical protein